MKKFEAIHIVRTILDKCIGTVRKEGREVG